MYFEDKKLSIFCLSTFKKFITNKSRAGASLFINTEMDLRNELDPMFIAWISNVDRSHIIDGKYGDEKKKELIMRLKY